MSFIASYAGICDACGEPIKPGQEIRDSTEAQRGSSIYEHVKCPAEVRDTGKSCPDCFLIHNGECF